jgi:hypothetical protein
MAAKRRIIHLVGPKTSRVRYGRAVLTIARDGNLVGGALGKAIVEYEQGSAEAKEVAQQFARARVLKHTPSFVWDEADTERVLRLVVKASDRPRFKSADPDHVASKLALEAQKEAEDLKISIEKIGVPSRISKQLDPALRSGQFDGLKRILRGFERTNVSLRAANLVHERTRSLLGTTRFLDHLRFQLPGLDRISLGLDHKQMKLPDFGVTSKAIDPGLFRAADWTRALPDPARWLPRLQKQMASWAESFKQALPANWRELDSDEIDRVVVLMKAEGLSLAWAPRLEITRALLAANDHEGRCDVLTRNSNEIIEDVEKVLAGVRRADLRQVAEAGFEAIRTYRDGHPAPAQTYAAAAVGEVIHGPLGWETFGEVRKAFKDKNPMFDVGFRDFPLFAVGSALVRTLDRFDKAADGFNRNLTQHRIGSPHSVPNFLMVLLLLAGLVREVERVLDRHDRREAQEAA